MIPFLWPTGGGPQDSITAVELRTVILNPSGGAVGAMGMKEYYSHNILQ